jgi:transcriptional regulator with XRE-family HTH domain
MSIGKRIDELLFDKQITQRQMADDLKISASTLNNYIRDYREPDVEMLKSIAVYFNVSVDYLLDFNPKSFEADSTALTVDEQRLINAYRLLDMKQQAFLIEQTKLIIRLNKKG